MASNEDPKTPEEFEAEQRRKKAKRIARDFAGLLTTPGHDAERAFHDNMREFARGSYEKNKVSGVENSLHRLDKTSAQQPLPLPKMWGRANQVMRWLRKITKTYQKMRILKENAATIQEMYGCKDVTGINLNFKKNARDEHLKYIAELFPNLEELDLFRCKKLTDKGIIYLARRCTHLVKLNLGSTDIDGTCLEALAEHCPSISELDISRCAELKEGHECLMNLPKFEKLSVLDVGSFAFQNEEFTPVAQCTQLRVLNLGGCQDITDANIVLLARGCSQLVELNLASCNQLTDYGITELAMGCPLLEELNIHSNDRITDNALFALAKWCPQLRDLEIDYCVLITRSGIIRLAACKKLKDLTFNGVLKDENGYQDDDAEFKTVRELAMGLDKFCYQYGGDPEYIFSTDELELTEDQIEVGLQIAWRKDDNSSSDSAADDPSADSGTEFKHSFPALRL